MLHTTVPTARLLDTHAVSVMAPAIMARLKALTVGFLEASRWFKPVGAAAKPWPVESPIQLEAVGTASVQGLGTRVRNFKTSVTSVLDRGMNDRGILVSI